MPAKLILLWLSTNFRSKRGGGVKEDGGHIDATVIRFYSALNPMRSYRPLLAVYSSGPDWTPVVFQKSSEEFSHFASVWRHKLHIHTGKARAQLQHIDKGLNVESATSLGILLTAQLVPVLITGLSLLTCSLRSSATTIFLKFKKRVKTVLSEQKPGKPYIFYSVTGSQH